MGLAATGLSIMLTTIYSPLGVPARLSPCKQRETPTRSPWSIAADMSVNSIRAKRNMLDTLCRGWVGPAGVNITLLQIMMDPGDDAMMA